MQGRIRVEGLRKTYVVRERRGFLRSAAKTVEALKGVCLEIQPGQIFGLLGPNGAGKTTLIKCLTTLLLPTSGKAWVNGYRLTEEDDRIRATLGCMLMGDRGLYWKLTGRENLEFFGALYHLDHAQRRRRAGEIIERLALGEIADRTVDTYSSGQKMTLAFGRALVNDAPVLILDEPTNTLDVPSAHALRATVRELNGAGKTVIYTTHILSEAELLCDCVAIIDRGEILALGSVGDLKASLDREEVIRVEGLVSPRAREAVARLPGVRRAALTPVNGHMKLTVVARDQRPLLPRLIETLLAHGALVQRITPEEATLEDVFLARTGRTLSESAEGRA